jgi:Tat protein translocase TatB subunit
MFGSLGVPEILMIFAVVLIVFGPRRIPEIGRTIGKFMAEFRKATDDFKGTIEREVRLEELKKIAPDMLTPTESVSRSEPESLPVDEWPSLQVETPAAAFAETTLPDDGTPPLDDSITRSLDHSETQSDDSEPETPEDSATRRLGDSTNA